ncbi:protealysin inhibitor emfourin [Billgrantia endophytica]|uniref:protealysin inhibitor emfourin n=1 Tax=Billgrantia endophytica TaxID=2033802 RepID=UPI0010549A0C|nr:protealysin inhibitor emfourin [Halomonas endophytica]
MTRSIPGEPPALTPGSVLRLSREGGLAHFPGLARPRCVYCARCSEEQLRELQSLLRELPRDGGAISRDAADRRRLCVKVVDERGTVVWSQTVPEESVPQALLDWWRRAEIAPP